MKQMLDIGGLQVPAIQCVGPFLRKVASRHFGGLVIDLPLLRIL